MNELILTITEAVARLSDSVRELEDQEPIEGPAGPPPSVEEIREAVENWFSENADSLRGEKGEDGRAPTATEIQNAANLFLSTRLNSFRPTQEEIDKAAAEWLELNIRQPKDGKSVTSGQIKTAVDTFLKSNIDLIRGAKGANGRDGSNGRNGSDGVGIAGLEQRSENSFFITLTNGEEYEIELPKRKRTVVAGGGGGNNEELEARLTALEFVPLAINQFSISPNVAVLGQTITSVNFNFSVSGNPLENLVTSINRGIGEVTSPHTATVNLTNSTTFTLTASADNQTTRTRNAGITFLNRVYFFTSDLELVTDEIVQSGQQFLTNSKNRTVTYDASPTGSFLCTAYPARLGSHNNITVNNLPNNDFTIERRPFTNPEGFTEDYFIYRSNNRVFGQGISVRWQ